MLSKKKRESLLFYRKVLFLGWQEGEIRTTQLLQKREFGIIHGYGAKVVRTLTISRCDGVTVTHEWTQTILDLDKREVCRYTKPTYLYKQESSL